MNDNKLDYEEDYITGFKTNKLVLENVDDPITREALEKALDIRKFEIDLYWKRATYFWGFLIVIFAGYFAVLSANFEGLTKREKFLALLLISCLGFIFSYGWFLVNKGSKFWQNNWERHVDMLEDNVIGPLYKTVLVEKKEKGLKSFLTSADEFSVSKINQLLSFFLVVIWSLLGLSNIFKITNDYIVNDLGKVWITNEKFLNFPIQEIFVLLITIYFVITLVKYGKSSHTNKNKANNNQVNQNSNNNLRSHQVNSANKTYFIVRDKPLQKLKPHSEQKN